MLGRGQVEMETKRAIGVLIETQYGQVGGLAVEDRQCGVRVGLMLLYRDILEDRMIPVARPKGERK